MNINFTVMATTGKSQMNSVEGMDFPHRWLKQEGGLGKLFAASEDAMQQMRVIAKLTDELVVSIGCFRQSSSTRIADLSGIGSNLFALNGEVINAICQETVALGNGLISDGVGYDSAVENCHIYSLKVLGHLPHERFTSAYWNACTRKIATGFAGFRSDMQRVWSVLVELDDHSHSKECVEAMHYIAGIMMQTWVDSGPILARRGKTVFKADVLEREAYRERRYNQLRAEGICEIDAAIPAADLPAENTW